MTDRLRIVIADDHPVFRNGLRALLESVGWAEVVGEAATGEQAVEVVADCEPDLVLMDIRMPGMNGIEATRAIVHRTPHVGVLVLTMVDDDDSVFSAMRAGARGYLLKGAEQADVLRAIQGVGGGEAIFGPAVAQRVIDYFSVPPPPGPPQVFPDLTRRELQILELIAQGEDNPAIARRLRIQAKTVRNNVSNIFLKLRVSDRAQAMLRAREAGLGRDRLPRVT